MTTRRPKKSRARGEGKVRLELSERDISILILIGSARYLTSTQLATEFFPSLDSCRKRLRRMLDNGLIKVYLYRSTFPNLIRLTPQGLKTLQTRVPAAAARLRLPGPIREDGILQHLFLVDVRLFAAHFGAQQNTPLKGWYLGESASLKKLGLDRFCIRPEALASFSCDDEAPILVAVVLDRPGRRWRPVLPRYRDAALAGAIDALWLVTADEPRRLRALADEVTRAGLDECAFVIPRACLNTRPVSEIKTVKENTYEVCVSTISDRSEIAKDSEGGW